MKTDDNAAKKSTVGDVSQNILKIYDLICGIFNDMRHINRRIKALEDKQHEKDGTNGTNIAQKENARTEATVS